MISFIRNFYTNPDDMFDPLNDALVKGEKVEGEVMRKALLAHSKWMKRHQAECEKLNRRNTLLLFVILLVVASQHPHIVKLVGMMF